MPGKFLNKLEDSLAALTEGLEIHWEKFPDGQESFQMVWTASRWPRKLPDGLECFQIASRLENVSRWPGKFPYGLKTFYISIYMYVLQKLSRFTKTFQVSLLPCYLGFSASDQHHHRHHYCHYHLNFSELSETIALESTVVLLFLDILVQMNR